MPAVPRSFFPSARRAAGRAALAIMAGIAGLSLVASASGCANRAEEGTDATVGPPAATEWDIRGKIVTVFPAEGAASSSDSVFGTIIVEGRIEEDTAYDKASISIGSITLMTLPADRATGAKAIKEEQATAEAFKRLKPGMTVQAVFAGPVAESYPVQGGAGTLEVLDGSDQGSD